jgi:hypothetical protein
MKRLDLTKCLGQSSAWQDETPALIIKPGGFQSGTEYSLATLIVKFFQSGTEMTADRSKIRSHANGRLTSPVFAARMASASMRVHRPGFFLYKEVFHDLQCK